MGQPLSLLYRPDLLSRCGRSRPGACGRVKAQTVEDASMPTDLPDLPQPEEGEELSLFDVLMPPGSAKDDENWMGNGGRRWCKVVRRSFSMTSPHILNHPS